MEEIDERREAAIAAKIRPDSNQNSNIKKSQFAKFQELHRRRLHLKAKPKKKKEECSDEEGISQVADEDSGNNNNNTKDDPLQQIHIQKETGSIKRQKLHWGLDTKERWERKSNM